MIKTNISKEIQYDLLKEEYHAKGRAEQRILIILALFVPLAAYIDSITNKIIGGFIESLKGWLVNLCGNFIGVQITGLLVFIFVILIIAFLIWFNSVGTGKVYNFIIKLEMNKYNNFKNKALKLFNNKRSKK